MRSVEGSTRTGSRHADMGHGLPWILVFPFDYDLEFDVTKEKTCFKCFFDIFSINLAASAAKYCEKGAVNQSAASAASLDPILGLFELFGFLEISSRDQVGC